MREREGVQEKLGTKNLKKKKKNKVIGLRRARIRAFKSIPRQRDGTMRLEKNLMEPTIPEKGV